VLRAEVIRQVKTRTDEKLPPPLLRQSKFHAVFHLGVNPVSKRSRLFLDAGEILATRRRADAWHILHYKHLRLEKFNVTQEFLVKMATRIIHQTDAMIRAVHLANRAEPLARGAAHNDINFLRADQFRQFRRREAGQVFIQNVPNLRQVSLENSNGLRVVIKGGQTHQSSPLQAEAEAATAAKQIYKIQLWRLWRTGTLHVKSFLRFSLRRRFAYILFFEAFVKPVELPVVRILLDLAVPFFEFFEVFLKFFERFFNLFPIEYQRFTWILENK
jgi:hypothetical protein